MLKNSLIIIATLFFSIFAHAEAVNERCLQIQSALRGEVGKVSCVSEKVLLADQPTNNAFKKLADTGFKTVINLRTDKEGADLEAEHKSVEQAGMKYIQIPIDSNNPLDSDAEAFIKAAKQETANPTFIHCGSANRAAAMWMIYSVVKEGEDKKAALAIAEKAGLKSEVMRKFAERYINEHKK